MNAVQRDSLVAEAEVLRAENQTLRGRLAMMSDAITNISENLDTEAILQEVINSA